MKFSIGPRPIQSRMMGGKGPSRFALRIGEIQRVDYENMVCDIHWLQGSSPPAREVRMTSAYWSRRGFLGAMPAEGSTVVCGFAASHEDQATQPYILAYLPNGYITALGFDPFGLAERGSVANQAPLDVLQRELDGIYGPTRHKMRKLYPGDVYGASDKGAEVILDEDARLLDTDGDELRLRAEDRTFALRSADYQRYGASIRVTFGRVRREVLSMRDGFVVPPPGTTLFRVLVDAGIIYEDGTFVPDINALASRSLPSGAKLVPIPAIGTTINDSRILVEHRVELMEETNEGIEIPEAPYEGGSPYIEHVMGTVVGDHALDPGARSAYGKPLRPSLFSAPTDTEGQPRMEVVGAGTESPAAYLYRMRRPDGGGEVFISHDKEGHYFISIPASSARASNLGAGRSVDMELRGSLKMVVGANQMDHQSMDLALKGGINLLAGTTTSNGNSLTANLKGGVSIKAGKNAAGSSFTWEGVGDFGIASSAVGIGAANDVLVDAGATLGMSGESVGIRVGTGDFNTTVLSSHNETITGQRMTSVGAGIKTTVLAPLGISAGTAIETMVGAGGRSTTFLLPSEDSIRWAGAGSLSVQAGAALSVDMGSPVSATYRFASPVGTFNVTVGTGTIGMAAASVAVEGAASVNITAPNIAIVGRVALGTATASLAVPGGIPGPSPYLDPLTGNPLTGNALVNVPV